MQLMYDDSSGGVMAAMHHPGEGYVPVWVALDPLPLSAKPFPLNGVLIYVNLSIHFFGCGMA